MKLKSYHAGSVESAIRLARIELGEEAVFLGSRQVEESEWEGRQYEVTFAVPSGGPPAAGGAERQAGSDLSREGPPGRRESASTAEPHNANGSSAEAEALGSKAAGWKRWLFPSLAAAEAAKPGHTGPLSTEDPGAPQAGPETAWDESRQRRDQATKPGATQRQNRRSASKPPHWKEYVPEAFAEPDLGEAVLGDLPGKPDSAAPGRPQSSPAATAGAVPAAARERATQPRPPGPAQEPDPGLTDLVVRMVSELGELRSAVERQAGPRWPSFLPSGKLLADARVNEIYAGMVANGLEPALAAQLVAGLESAAAQGTDRKGLRTRLQGQLRELCRVANQLGRPGSEPRLVALVGPSGVGKTSTVAKLAIRYGLVQQHRVQLMGIDQQRVGAAEPLEAYAELLGTPLTIVDHWEDLPAALQSAADPQRPDQAELVLIDTPGYGPAEWSRARRLAEGFTANGAIDVHLVLSAAAKAADLRRTVDRYQIFQPAKLIFTRLDETDSHGALFNEMVRTRLPLSFLTAGQRVPEDILPASEAYLTKLLLKNDLVS